MNAIWIAFDIKHNGGKLTPSYNFVELMLILDVKIDFQRKACMAVRGDQTVPPLLVAYFLVVSRKNVWIAFLVTALNDLDITLFDMGNTYLVASVAEKLYTVLGIEFGEDQGKLSVIV